MRRSFHQNEIALKKADCRRYDRRGEGGGGEGVPFLVQRVHDSRRYNSTLLSGPSSDTAAKEILILCPDREIE